MQTFKEHQEAITKTILTEMAYEKKKAEQIITGLSLPIIEHLVKILYWEDSSNIQKHINDIDTWLLKINNIKIKPSSSNPKTSDLYKWLFTEPVDNENSIKNIVKYLSLQYKLKETGRSTEEIYKILTNLYLKVAEDLSNSEFETIAHYINTSK